jgi:hypothetical protein
MSPPGLRMAWNSPTEASSFSRIDTVQLVLGVSTSSGRIRSAREPVSWPKIPTAFTDGLWSGMAGLTSKRLAAARWSSRSGSRHWSSGISRMRRMQNCEKSSARVLEADTTMIFFCGSFLRSHST